MAENLCLFFSPLPLLHFYRHPTYWQGNVWNRRLRWQTKKAHNLFISDSRFIFHTVERPDSELWMHGFHFPSCLYIRVMYSVSHRTEKWKKKGKKNHYLVAFQGSFIAPKFGDDLSLCCWSYSQFGSEPPPWICIWLRSSDEQVSGGAGKDDVRQIRARAEWKTSCVSFFLALFLSLFLFLPPQHFYYKNKYKNINIKQYNSAFRRHEVSVWQICPTTYTFAVHITPI